MKEKKGGVPWESRKRGKEVGQKKGKRPLSPSWRENPKCPSMERKKKGKEKLGKKKNLAAQKEYRKGACYVKKKEGGFDSKKKSPRSAPKSLFVAPEKGGRSKLNRSEKKKKEIRPRRKKGGRVYQKVDPCAASEGTQ